jgi:hypothetical protein
MSPAHGFDARRRAAVLVAIVIASLFAANFDPPAADADVSAVSGSAYGSFASVSFFGSPPNVRGPQPTVTLPAGGGNETASAPTGSAVFGPAIIFSSGPIAVTTTGTTGVTGSVTSTANIQDINTSEGEVLTADNLSSTCTASEAGVSGSTTITNGTLILHDPDPDVSGEEGEEIVTLPTNPEPNTTYVGQISPPINDTFRYVFNEQIVNPDGSITVNAAHQYLQGPTAVGDLIIGQVQCGVTTTTTTTTTEAPTTTTTEAPTTTTTSTPGPGGPISFDDLALSDGSVARLTGTITCDEGNRFRIQVALTQGDTEGAGTATGTCTGDSQRFQVVVNATSGPGFEDGAAQVDATAQIGRPGTRAVVDTFSTTEEVEIDLPRAGTTSTTVPGTTSTTVPGTTSTTVPSATLSGTFTQLAGDCLLEGTGSGLLPGARVQIVLGDVGTFDVGPATETGEFFFSGSTGVPNCQDLAGSTLISRTATEEITAEVTIAP